MGTTNKFLKFNTKVQVNKFLLNQLKQNTPFILFLSGGSTPKDFYSYLSKNLANIKNLKEVYLVDERYGSNYHKESNELTIKHTNLQKALLKNNIKYHKILCGKSFNITAQKYNILLRDVKKYKGSVYAIFGMGLDAHIAGIFANSNVFSSKKYAESVETTDAFKKRITITPYFILKFISNSYLFFIGDEKLKVFNKNYNSKNIKKYPVALLSKINTKVVYLTGE